MNASASPFHTLLLYTVIGSRGDAFIFVQSSNAFDNSHIRPGSPKRTSRSSSVGSAEKYSWVLYDAETETPTYLSPVVCVQ